MEKPTALTKFFETRLAIIEVNEGETEEEAWRRYLATNPGYANAHIKIFHYPAKVTLSKAKGPLEVSPFSPGRDKRQG